MEITFAHKISKPVFVGDLPVGAIFIREFETHKPKEEVDHFLIVMRNGHREYINLNDSVYYSLPNDKMPVIQMDCALTVYGPK